MNEWLQRWIKDPKTTIIGVAQIAGGVLYLTRHLSHITPEELLNPEGFLPVIAISSGLGYLFSADAKHAIPASEVKPDTEVVVEKK